MLNFEYIDVNKIDFEDGLRQTLKKEPLDELTTSIARHGVLQPLVVESKENGRYNLQIGCRRLTASRTAGLEIVPAIVLDRPLGPEESLEVRLVENLHREELDPIDEAEAYATLKEMGVKVSEIARRVGKSRPYVSHTMRLLNLHPKVRNAVRQRTINREHALTLLRLKQDEQLSITEEIQKKGLTLIETRERVREILGKSLKWRLVPVRIEPEKYEKLEQVAPNGDVAMLFKQVVDTMILEEKD